MSKQQATETPTSSTSTDEGPTNTPTSTASGSSQRTSTVKFTSAREAQTEDKAEAKDKKQSLGETEKRKDDKPEGAKMDSVDDAESKRSSSLKKKGKCKSHEHKKKTRVKKSSTKKARKDKVVSDGDSDDSDEETSSSDSSDDQAKQKKKNKDKKDKHKKQRRKGKKQVESSSESSDSEESDESTDSSSSEEDIKSRKGKKSKTLKKKDKKKAQKAKDASTDTAAEKSEDEKSNEADEMAIKTMQQQMADFTKILATRLQAKKAKPKTGKAKDTSVKEEASSLFKRVDEVWDTTIHNYKLKDSTEENDSKFSEYAFLVRRTFNWENRPMYTYVDIKSRALRSALQVVMKDCKGVSLEAEEPCIEPNTLFLYLDEMRTYYKKTLKSQIKKEKKKKLIKKLQEQREHLKSLVQYIDEDYEKTKKTLYPLLKAGNITFELIWALFHPNDIAVTATYGVWDEPRCFKVNVTHKHMNMTKGEWYGVYGKYLEYDGKAFGYGHFMEEIEKFQGPRKITSLDVYPLKYHKDPEKVKKQIRERGERFISMEGMHYKLHTGLAFMKKKKQVLKININGRIMIDPATFRRINPNYPISWIKPREEDEDLFSLDSDDSDSDDDGCGCGGHDSDDDSAIGSNELSDTSDYNSKPRYKYKWADDGKGNEVFLAVEVDKNGDPVYKEHVDRFAENPDLRKRVFTEEELLLTSPVMLGFSFSEKLWLEFTISGINNIEWNENAFDSLVLPPNQKSIVRALVESHKLNGAKTIDDVVQGKGKGLVSVLHGPPGTGKTLTAEGISELLRCPLYMVSAGELGTNPERLEHELQKILDIAHSWGAVLLLDEADVFLEKREVHDIHRNALVSIFLRLLEYFQGILFLTTNRVETFDDAFQSRIHVALRYGELTHKAKKTVWKMFVDLVREKGNLEVEDIKDRDLETLARNELNGRQIKNLVRTAEALALNEGDKLTMNHVKRVLDVAETFDRDLKGGTGYIDAMRSYT